ncbi:hypothetical protein F4780DRAFT_780457 [Xylariomycetidae sp. FL0641]|nr:hypothetical protein F4780DRAFT_780457 [Xylariomycetidae sp. FL0641]
MEGSQTPLPQAVSRMSREGSSADNQATTSARDSGSDAEGTTGTAGPTDQNKSGKARKKKSQRQRDLKNAKKKEKKESKKRAEAEASFQTQAEAEASFQKQIGWGEEYRLKTITFSVNLHGEPDDVDYDEPDDVDNDEPDDLNNDEPNEVDNDEPDEVDRVCPHVYTGEPDNPYSGCGNLYWANAHGSTSSGTKLERQKVAEKASIAKHLDKLELEVTKHIDVTKYYDSDRTITGDHSKDTAVATSASTPRDKGKGKQSTSSGSKLEPQKVAERPNIFKLLDELKLEATKCMNVTENHDSDRSTITGDHSKDTAVTTSASTPRDKGKGKQLASSPTKQASGSPGKQADGTSSEKESPGANGGAAGRSQDTPSRPPKKRVL